MKFLHYQWWKLNESECTMTVTSEVTFKIFGKEFVISRREAVLPCVKTNEVKVNEKQRF